MDRVAFLELNRAKVVDRVAGNIKDPAEGPLAYRHGDRTTRVAHGHAAFQSFGRRHGDGADPVLTQMLLDFEGELGGVAVDFVLDLERVVDAGQGAGKLHVHHGTDNLNDISFIHKIVLAADGELGG